MPDTRPTEWFYGAERLANQSFDRQIFLHIERGDLIDVIEHPNQSKYPNQQMLVVKIRDYAYLVPFIEDEDGKFLKTIIPSRKATREYLGG